MDTKAELDEAVDREEAVSLEYLPPVLSYLLNQPADDPEAYSDDVASLLNELVQNGYDPLFELLEDKGGAPEKSSSRAHRRTCNARSLCLDSQPGI